MSSLDEFLSNPPAFMRKNYVTYKGAFPENVGGGVHDFLLVPAPRHRARRAIVALGLKLGKADAGVFEIRACRAAALSAEAQANGQRFTAVWGGFSASGRVQCALSSTGPDLMLTPELSGCTVAFSSGNGGASRFSHYNLFQEGAGRQTLNASDMLAEVNTDYGDQGALGFLSKEDYRGRTKNPNNVGAATVIGWRVNGVWTFWVQYLEIKGDVYQIRGVEQLQHDAHLR